MPNKTIYVKQDDAEVWESAAYYAQQDGQNISALLAVLLRKWIAKKGDRGVQRMAEAIKKARPDLKMERCIEMATRVINDESEE